MSKIFLDPGHGGNETGAVNQSVLEKNINLIVALETKRILELNKQEVLMSRESDISLSLIERCKMANDFKADLLISIHHNANNTKSKDAEIYHSVNNGIGKELSEKIANEFYAIGQPTKVLSRESINFPGKDYYTIIGKSNMPSIITEFGYMDNPNDYIQFDEIVELHQEALAIAKGILNQIGYNENVLTKNIVTEEHWAESIFKELNSLGVTINEKRFEDKITRGESMALALRLFKALKK